MTSPQRFDIQSGGIQTQQVLSCQHCERILPTVHLSPGNLAS